MDLYVFLNMDLSNLFEKTLNSDSTASDSHVSWKTTQFLQGESLTSQYPKRCRERVPSIDFPMKIVRLSCKISKPIHLKWQKDDVLSFFLIPSLRDFSTSFWGVAVQEWVTPKSFPSSLGENPAKVPTNLENINMLLKTLLTFLAHPFFN